MTNNIRNLVSSILIGLTISGVIIITTILT